jgi:hypothetical protein
MSNGSHPDPALEAKLTRLHLRFQMPDQDTLVVKNVPADHRSFSKAKTNLLIKRATGGMVCVVGVDEGLDYAGTDPALARTFASGSLQNGWRVLTFGGCLQGDLTAALEYALDFLGAGEEACPSFAASVAPGKSLLAAWAENLTEAVHGDRVGPTLCRDEEIEQIAACVLGWQGRLPLILGEAGTGKTNLLCGTATVLARRKRKILAVNTGALMAGTLLASEREVLLRSLLREAKDSGVVLALEQAEWAVIGLRLGPVLLREALDSGVRLIATSSMDHLGQFDIHPLASRLEIVQLSELCSGDACRVVEALSPSIAAHHTVRIDGEVERAVVERCLSMEGLLPGKAVRLLDAAAARARLTGSEAVTLMDVYVSASRMLPDERT